MWKNRLQNMILCTIIYYVRIYCGLHNKTHFLLMINIKFIRLKGILFMKKYGILIIGCGYIGEIHVKDIYYKNNVSIVGAVDINKDTAEKFAKKFNAKSFSTSYLEYLKSDEVDIVIISTYPDAHKQILQDCVLHNKHVLCEKPLSNTLKDTLDCIDIMRNAPVSKVLVGHILRHSPTYLKVKELISEGAIGDLKLFRVCQNHHARNWQRYGNLLNVCPPIVDCGVHYIDVIQWFSGSKVTRVSGMGCIIDDEAQTYNYGLATMTLENGCTSYFEAGWSKNISGSNVKEFVGTKGHITITLDTDRPCRHEEGDLIEHYDDSTQTYYNINMRCGVKNMVGQFEYLLSMIEENAPSNPSLDDIESSMRVAFACDEAIKTGSTINL